MSSDPTIMAQVQQMRTQGIDPTTGKIGSVASQVLGQGYSISNDTGAITDPSTGQVIGNLNTPGFDPSTLKPSGRGAPGINPNDATQTQPAPATPTTPPGTTFTQNLANSVTPQVPQTATDATTGTRTASPPSFTNTLSANTTPTNPTSPATPAAPPSPPPTNPASFTANLASTTPNTTPTTVDNTLTGQTIGAPTLNDPQTIAQSEWDAWERQTDPAYEASLRDANRSAAAGGALGSGELNTTTGTLAANRALALDTERQQLMAGALTQGNENAYRNVGIAQQQQGFQNQQQQQAFSEAMQSQQLSDAEKSQSFTEALQQELAGSSGSPADTQLALSQIFGGQASAAAAALAALMRTSAQTSAAGGANANAGLISQLQQYLNSINGGNTNTQQPQPDVPIDPATGYPYDYGT
jgi:hypothetical protein